MSRAKKVTESADFRRSSFQERQYSRQLTGDITREWPNLCLADSKRMSSSGPHVKPFFLVTIDTEGDNLWEGPREITTRNASFLDRFQGLCDRYGVKPTYLTNFEMVRSPVFRELASDVLRRGRGEVGMHLHAWNSPPALTLTSDDFRNLPYLVEYPDAVMREKIRVLTGELESTFGVKMVSHRAGRWNIDGRYIAMLLEAGYQVDCSVTPLVSWRAYKGHPDGHGGADYRSFPQEPYWIDPADVSKPGASPLLEVPMTILPYRAGLLGRTKGRLLGAARRLRGVERDQAPVTWLRPNGRNLNELLLTVRQVRDQRSYAEFMLHSSELMPAGSPTFRTAASIDRLYDHLHQLFEEVSGLFRPGTLSEFHDAFCRRSEHVA